MKTLIILKSETFDATIFAHCLNGEITGLNFHYGLGETDRHYEKPCEILTELYLFFKKESIPNSNAIEKAIDYYEEKFLLNDELECLENEVTELDKIQNKYVLKLAE